jgi:hypothetical protein
LVVKSNKGSTRTLIPAIVTDINKSTGVSDPMVTSEMMVSQIMKATWMLEQRLRFLVF